MALGLGLGVGLMNLTPGGGGGGGFNEATATLRLDAFSADGTWNRPTLDAFWGLTGNANRAQIELWAPGAGGTTNTGGGGGGAYAKGNDVDVSGSATYAVAGLAAGAANTNSTDATFGTTLVVAKGALSGGNGGTGGQASASTGDTKRDGGNGALGAGNQAGGGGAGADAAGSGAAGGMPDGGLSSASAAGRFLGGGGGSGTAAQSAGARGQCVVAYNTVATAGYARLRSYKFTRTEASSTNHSVTLPSGVAAGDWLVMWVVADGNIATITAAGWDQMATDANGTILRGAAFRRLATGTDTTTVVTDVGTTCNIAVWRFAGAGTPTATMANGSSTNADPPSHTTGGAAVNGIWLACCGLDASTVQDISAAPASYGSFVAQGPISGRVQTAFALRELNAATEDPGAFTSGTEQWVSTTILVPPA